MVEPPRGVAAAPLVHITSLSMNDLLLIITRPPSTTMHCIPCVRSFGHLLVIKMDFSAKQSIKIHLFKIKNLKFWRRGHCPLPQNRGGSPASPTSVPRFDLLTSYNARPVDLRSCFVFEQFEHWQKHLRNSL